MNGSNNSSALEYLTTRTTGMRAIWDNKPMTLMSARCPTLLECPTHPMVDEYMLRGEVGTIFRCRLEDYDQAKHYARKMLVREVYREVLQSISILHSLAYSGDTSAIQQELTKLEEWING